MATISASIVSVRAVAIVDDDADFSYIGEYTNRADDWNIHRPSGEFVIDHKRKELSELLPEAKQMILDRWSEEIADGASVVFCDDDDAIENRELTAEITYDDGDTDTDWVALEYSPQEYSREYTYFAPYAGGEPAGSDDYRKYAMSDYRRMESLNRGDWHYVGIRCVATIDVNGKDLEIESPGLWGVESDSGREYFAEIIGEQLTELRAQLLEFGFSEDEIEFPEPSELAEQLDD